MSVRIGIGYDVHAFGPGDHIVSGGVAIPHSRGFVAHSDGDVLVHSVCDALLGALALGDIGNHFPDTDNTYKGIDSMILLSKVYQLIEDKGYSVGNIDCTVIAQAPKMAPYIDAMRVSIAEAMGVEAGCVSVKATTTEHLGFEGRQEGIAAQAAVILTKK